MSRDFIVQAQVIKREAPFVQVGSVVTIVGKDGSLIYSAAGVPSNSLGVYTDLYIDTVAPNNFYQKNASNIWVLKGSLKGVSGDDGREVLIQNDGTYIQWQYEGDTEWTNIVELSTLKGDTGANIELNKSATHIQWRVVGDTNWIDLVALSELKGQDGYTPQKGIDYFDGYTPIKGVDYFDGITPTIGLNGNWYIGTTDTGVKAAGTDGTNGLDGTDGVGISDIEKTGTILNVDEYTITFTDASTFLFYVTNGLNGADGTNGTDGRGIVSIIKTSTVGLVDTYTITYTDSTTSTFDVTNGEKGDDGTSAYEIYHAGGGTLSEAEFNESITNIPSHIADDSIHHTIDELDVLYEPKNSNIQEHIADTTKHIDTTTAEFSGTIDETNDKLTIWDNSLLKWIRFSFTSLKTYLNGIYHKFDGSSFGAKQIIGSTDNQDFGIITNNTERLTVLKNGNVGIGENNPTAKLYVNGTLYQRSGSGIITSKLDSSWVSQTSSLTVSSGASASVLINPAGGNVGIGTIIPKSKLQVAGGIQCGDDTAAASADKVGTRRNRTGAVGNVGFYVSEECAQTDVNTYAWVEIFRNEWIIP